MKANEEFLQGVSKCLWAAYGRVGESSSLRRAAEEAVDWGGGDGLQSTQELEQEVMKDVADASQVCLP